MRKSPIVLHYGPMASEKSLALIQEYRKARSVDEVCRCFVPAESKDGHYVISRFMQGEGGDNNDEIKIPATGVSNSAQLYDIVEKELQEVYALSRDKGMVIARLRMNVIIDEIQLLDDDIKSVIEDLAHNGIRVVCSGLDLDYRGEPFPLRRTDGKENNGGNIITVPDIMGIASETHRHYARCAHIMADGAACGDNATRSQRFKDVERKEPSHYDDGTVIVDPRHYIPVCEEHHVVPGKHRSIFVGR